MLREITADVRALKAAWEESMRKAQVQVLVDIGWGQRDPNERRSFTFEMFYKAGVELVAADFAEPLGCADACRRRGLGGLLAVPAVHVCMGVAMSQMYAEGFGHAGQRDVRLPNRNDGNDLWHAILGSTGEIFVTFGRRAAGHLERIPGAARPRIVSSVTERLQLV